MPQHYYLLDTLVFKYLEPEPVSFKRSLATLAVDNSACVNLPNVNLNNLNMLCDLAVSPISS